MIESKTGHDFATCSCGKCGVDGGLEYFRRAAETMLEKLILDIERTVINAEENISYSVNHTITETYWTIGK